MPSFNRVTLMGNLTRDPQLKELPSGTTVTEFGLAMSRRYKTQAGEDREEVCFVDCSAFGKQAEVINQYCRKGKPVFIEGRLKYDTWDDKMGGGKRSKLAVVVENFQFVGSREDNERVHRPMPGAREFPSDMFGPDRRRVASNAARDRGRDREDDRAPERSAADDEAPAAEKSDAHRAPAARDRSGRGKPEQVRPTKTGKFTEAEIPF